MKFINWEWKATLNVSVLMMNPKSCMLDVENVCNNHFHNLYSLKVVLLIEAKLKVLREVFDKLYIRSC